VEVPGGEYGNVQIGGGDRVSTISLPGCSTSVALATGPTDEEEEEEAAIYVLHDVVRRLYSLSLSSKYQCFMGCMSR